MTWKTRCLIDTAKAVLPCQSLLRGWKDRLLGYSRLPATDAVTIRDGLELIRWLGDLSGRRVLEIGTGWEPMLPILYSLAGATVYTADLHRLVRADTLNAALESLREARDSITAALGISPEVVDCATRPSRDVDDRLRELRINYLAPCDCRSVPLPSGSIDAIVSRAVLEHIPPRVLSDICRESRRLLFPGGQMLHLIDHSDHWSHRDRRITGINFLRYPAWQFRLTCLNPQDYQNRMRHSQYVEMLRVNGFSCLREERTIDPRCLAAIRSIPIDRQFARFSDEDLATTRSTILAR